MFRIMFIGDIVGRSGVEAVTALVPGLREELRLDAVVANAENSAPQGRGVTAESGAAVLSVADFLTLGNHAFDAEDGKEYLDREERVVRPANLDSKLPGRGWGIFEAGGVRVGVTNVQGRVFMKDDVGSPFDVAGAAVEELRGAGADVILIDTHAEATSEKQAVGYHLDGRAQVVVGTHTHIPTADTRVLPNGTAYVTDVGMCGVRDSVIGFSRNDFLGLFLGEWRPGVRVAEGPAVFNAVVAEIDLDTGRARSIENVHRNSG